MGKEFICLYDNTKFDNVRSYSNHARFVYKGKSAKEIFLLDNPEYEIPLCKYCGKQTFFISHTKGFHDCWCGDKLICKQNHITETNKKIGKNRKSFKETISSEVYLKYILDNWDFYYSNMNRKNIIDTYTEKNIGNISLRQYISRYVNLSKINKCLYCDDSINTNYFDDTQICHDCISKKIYNWGYKKVNKRILHNCIFILKYKGLSLKQVKEIFKNVFNISIPLLYNSISIGVDYFKCPETGYFLPKINKTTIVKNHVEKFGFDYLQYIKKYFPEYISYCKNCGKLSWYSISLTKTAKEKDKPFCSHKCYYEYKKAHPEEYEYSENQKRLFSLCMKRSIQKGLINPAHNHYKRRKKPIEYNGLKFRSSWEYLFYIAYKGNIEYETLRIPYFSSSQNKNRIYIVDFIDKDKKLVYEIKPSCKIDDTISMDKKNALLKWCENNNYEFLYITEEWFKTLDKSVYNKVAKEYKKYVKQFFI